jgi:hypothetical protein
VSIGAWRGYSGMDDKAPFTRIVELLSSVPGAVYRVTRYENESFLVWSCGGRVDVMSQYRAKFITEEELDTLAIELTFGVG